MGMQFTPQTLRQMVTTIMVLMLTSMSVMAVERTSPSTADHSQFKALQGPFQSGPEVTAACKALN